MVTCKEFSAERSDAIKREYAGYGTKANQAATAFSVIPMKHPSLHPTTSLHPTRPADGLASPRITRQRPSRRLRRIPSSEKQFSGCVQDRSKEYIRSALNRLRKFVSFTEDKSEAEITNNNNYSVIRGDLLIPE